MHTLASVIDAIHFLDDLYTSPPCTCLQRKHAEQIMLNHQLMDEISELQQEAKLIQEIPQRLSESVGNCKDVYEDILSIVQVKSIPMFQFGGMGLMEG